INPLFPGFSYVFSSNDARVVLNALTSITDVRVISAPQLVVLDNEQARLQVGDQVPIATQQATSVTDPNAPLVNTIEYRDTGVILEVIPHVNSSGLVTLDITQEVSDVAETKSSGIDSPTIQQRQITSTVAVQTGETVALGGLIRDRHSEGVTGIPLLSDIPLLGNLFKTTSDKDDRTELLILLTPHVIRNSQDARVLTEELRRRIPSVTTLENRLKAGAPETPEE
ncbi:MAG: type II secretion system protein GspD, partial [Hypericibacter sp.]